MTLSIFDVFFKYYPLFLKGLVGTLKYAAIAVFFGSILGSLISLLNISRNKVINTIGNIYVTVLRGTPLLVQMYIAYYFLPMAIPAFNAFSKEQCVVFSLILNSSAYVAEIIRGGISSVDIGQMEAARSLGMSYRNAMVRIILPQAVRAILPSLANEYIAMVKETSLAGTFMLYELMHVRTLLMNQYLVWQPLFIIAFIYLVVTVFLSTLVKLLEKRLAVSDKA
ncbi:MAG: amino acid ABC transporter permease [Erysipelotrichaceae bacterium]|nr:amino acid ABC transporter permease [Erysipelotrichaceae bacterium]